jgi:hypothetical protein
MNTEDEREYIIDKYNIDKCLFDHKLYEDEEKEEDWLSYDKDYKDEKIEEGWQKRISTKIHNNEKSETIWCNDCSKVYHDICENGIEQLSKIYSDIKTYDDIDRKCSEPVNFKLNLSNLKVQKEELENYSKALNSCKRYRKNQHKNCYKNIYDENQKEGDPGHKKYIQKLNNIEKKCKNVKNSIQKHINNRKILNIVKSRKIRTITKSKAKKRSKLIRSRR